MLFDILGSNKKFHIFATALRFVSWWMQNHGWSNNKIGSCHRKLICPLGFLVVTNWLLSKINKNLDPKICPFWIQYTWQWPQSIPRSRLLSLFLHLSKHNQSFITICLEITKHVEVVKEQLHKDPKIILKSHTHYSLVCRWNIL